MGCVVPIAPVWTPSGWNPSSQAPGATTGIAPPTTVVPSGAGVAFIQLSIESANPGDACWPTDPNGNQAGAPVRVQTANIYNETLGFAPLYLVGSQLYFYIRNNASGHNVNVWIVVLGYC
jgi:hypothetical protein